MRKLFVNVFFFLLVPIFVESLNPSLNDDVLGLIVFKSDVQDPNEKLTSWNEEDDSPCNWKGIKCNPRSNRVSEVVLDGFGLSGKISRGLLRLQFLRKLSLANNDLTGSISSLSLAQLHNLKILDLSANTLSGPIPPDYFQQCGPLRSISFANNQFSGQIPESLSSCVTLASLNLSLNQFSGLVPSGVWSLNGLRSLDLSKNFLDGEIPVVIQGLSNLRAVNLGRNRFKGEIPDGIGGCLLLRSIDLSENAFSGELPSTMHKFSLCNEFILRSNAFVGILPEWIGEMKSLEILDFSGNAFSGQVPASVRKLELLKVLNLSQNEISGSFPESMSTCVNLFALDVSHNSLTGTIPETVSQLKSLEILDLSENRLNGSIPAGIGGLTSLRELRLAKNALEGVIPRLIGNCSSLASLSLSHNALTGPVPADLAKLTYLQKVDFSFNKLTGMLPKQLGDLGHLLSFNISHNQLQGELPSNGFFNTISPYSVSANPSICGAAVNRSCSTVMPKPIVLNPNSTDSTSPTTIGQTFRHEKKILSISALIAIGAAAIIFVGVIAITVLNIRVRSAMPRHRSAALTFSGGDDFSPSPSTDANSGKLVMFSGDPDFSTGAHALLNKDCELGRGGFGAVYHTLLKDGHAVAIKKLTVSSLVKSQEDFEREVRKLGKVGHHNLVSLEGYYWTPSLQLLIYEFVGGGNLYKHLHEGCGLSWNKRFNILVGTAKGMASLHEMNIIHYNLKSSNILIDSSSGEAKVADYGLARLLPMLDRYVLSSKIQSALGYMAPEFACKTVKITEKCDVYGFGVVILEVVTGKRPVEYMEDDVVVLCDMVRGALEEGRIEDCVDERLQGKFAAEEAIPVIKLGLICTSQVPSNRPDMAQVVNILELIRCPDELV